MGFSNVLIKLLPFTSWDAAGVIITFFIVLLLGVFGYNFYKLWQSKKTDAAMITDLHDTLTQYQGKMQADYNDFVAELGDPQTGDELAKLWKEFDASLITVTNDFTGEAKKYKSIDADYFFNKHSLLSHLGTKYYASIPSILLGIGLIGTFVGLFYGLVQLDMSNPDILKSSMQNLIHAAGAKFASSIWGLGLSLVFTFYEKRAESQLLQKIEQIQNLINRSLPFKTAEQSLAILEAESKKQTETLQSLSISLTQDTVNKLSEALGQKIKETLEEAIGKPIQSLTANIGGSPEHTMYQRLDALAGGMGEGFADVMKNLMKEMVNEIRGVAGADAQQLQDTLRGLANTLNGLQTSLTQSANQTQQATEGTLTALNTALASINTTMATQTQSLDESMGKLLSIIDAQSIATQGNTDKMSAGAVQATGQISTAVETALTNIHEAFAGIKSTIEQSKNYLAPVPEYLQQFADGTKNLRDSAHSTNEATGLLGGSVTKLSGFETAMQTAMVGFATALTNQQTPLQNIAQQLGESATKAGEISEKSEQTYTNLAEAYRELSDKNKESIDGFKQSVEAYQEQANQNIKNTLSAFDGQLKDFASSLGGAIVELNEAVSDLADTVPRR